MKIYHITHARVSFHALFWAFPGHIYLFICLFIIFIYYTDEAYTFPLDVACKKKSEKELNEKDEERIGSVRALRKWALERQDWLKTPVGRFMYCRANQE